MNCILFTGCDRYNTRTETVCAIGLILKSLNCSFYHFDSTTTKFEDATKCILSDGTQCLANLGVIERFLDLELKTENIISKNKKQKFGNFTDADFAEQLNNFSPLNTQSEIILLDVSGNHEEVRSRLGRANVYWVHAVDNLSSEPMPDINLNPNLVVMKKHQNGGKPPNNCLFFISYSANTSKYDLPLEFINQRVDSYLRQKLENLQIFSKIPAKYAEYWDFIKKKGIPIAVVCDLTDSALFDCFDHAIWEIKHNFTVNKIKAADLEMEEETEEYKLAWKTLTSCHGITVGGGAGKLGAEGRAIAAEYARVNKIPFLGICYGMQYCAIEFARNVCGLRLANTTEVEPETPHPIFIRTKGTGNHGNQRIKAATSNMINLAGSEFFCERNFNSFQFNDEYVKIFEKFGMSFAGFSAERGNVEIVELPSHPFYVGTQFHSEFNSRFGATSRFYTEFLRAATKK